MRRLLGWKSFAGLLVLSAFIVFGVPSALANHFEHGMGVTKGCNSPTKIGDPYVCNFTMSNVLDDAGDDITVTSLVDRVSAAAGTQTSPNIIGAGRLVLLSGAGTAVCNGTGLGTVASPWLNSTQCLFHAGGRVRALQYSFYTVNANDYNANASHILTDQVSMTWQDKCTNPEVPSTCPIGDQVNTSGSQTTIIKLVSQTTTEIHDNAHNPVLVVEAGTTVHDLVTVTGEANKPPPTGNVNIDWFLNGDCSGTPAQNSGSVGPLDANGQFDATGFAFTVNSAGFRSFKAHYEGNSLYGTSIGPCEPLQIVDANITITPSATNRVGEPHTFTVTVNKNSGTGLVAAANEDVDFSLVNANGALAVLDAAASTCDDPGNNTNAAGQCLIVFTSQSPGQVTGNASVSLTVAGVSLVRSTAGNAGPGGSGPAVKRFVDARIHITPSATNRVGEPHTFIAHVEKNLGLGGGWVDAAGEPVTISLTNSNGAVATPAGPFNGTTSATGRFSVTFTSASPGQVTGHASSTLDLGAVSGPITVQTNGVGQNGSDAVKTFVDARIHITPSATNRVGEPHTFIAHVEKNLGLGGGWVDAAGEPVTISLTNSNGAAATPAGPFNGTTNATGRFSATFTSASPGQVTGHASSTLNLGSAQDPITVQTNGVGQNGSDAVKTFVNARIHITPSATNEVNEPHTFIAHVEKNLGLGGGWVDAVGEPVTISLTNSNGGVATPAGPFNGITNAIGEFAVTFTSATAGQVTGHASSSLILGSAQDPITVQTDGVGQNGSDAVKTFVDANITITPDATNEVGEPHTFTVTVKKNLGDGAGFVAAANEDVDFSLVNSNGAAFSLNGALSTCDDAGNNTNAAGQCLIVFTSPTAGKVTGNASVTVTVAGNAMQRDTDPATGAIGSGPGGSGSAVKTFVDANITITPDATNEVGEPHTFTVTVKKNLGDGAGFVAAANEDVDFSLVNSNGAAFALDGAASTCDDAGNNTNALGQCLITFTSPTAGKVTGNASVTVTVAGNAMQRDTDPATAAIGAGPGGSGPAVKTFVDANITITPNAINRVGEPHTFTVTVKKNLGDGAGFVAAANEDVDFSLVNSNGAAFALNGAASTCDDAGNNTNAAGQCLIVFTSPDPGQVTGNASVTVTIAGNAMQRDTDPATAAIGAGPGGSGPAVKTFVDARIHITPSATNRVNEPHTFTAHVEKNLGLGGGWVDAAGESVTISLTNSNGGLASPAGPFTGTTNATGRFAATFTSASPGQVTGHASSTLNLGAVSGSFTVQTNGVGQNGSDALKTFVDARIHITPSATNEVNEPHTFTALLEKNLGLGAGWVPAGGESITITLTNSNGGVATPAGPFNGTTNAAGQFGVTFTSATAGQITGHATSTLDVGAASGPFTVQTNGVGQNGSDAVKTFVDANITITPTATNRVGEAHTFTVTVKKNLGDGGGFVPAANEDVNFSLVNSNGAAFALDGAASTCDDAGNNTNAAGQCLIVFTSPDPGQVTGNASVTVTIAGNAMQRDTDPATAAIGSGPGGSSSAVKTFVDARIHITPSETNEVGQPHTFTAHLEKNLGVGGGWVDAAGETVTIALSNSAGATATPAGPFTGTTNATGRFSATFTSATAGQVDGHASSTINLGTVNGPFTVETNGVGQNGSDAIKKFVDAKIEITPNESNEVGEPHVFTITVTAINPANAPGLSFGTITPSVSPAPSSSSNTCAAPSGSGNVRTCTLTISNTTAQTAFTANATASVTIDGVTMTRDTDPATAAIGHGPGGTDSAFKQYVDARITISPLADTNPVSTNHTLTVNVQENLGAGFVNRNGALVTFSLTNANGATAVFEPVGANTCTTAGAGVCSVTIKSPTAGTTTINATTTFVINGTYNLVTVTRATGDGKSGDSADAKKLWIVTAVHNDTHGDITNTSVDAPAKVHDHLFTAALPPDVNAPGGTADFRLYSNDTCGPTAGTLVQEWLDRPITSGDASSPEITLTPGSTTNYAYRVHYDGQAGPPAYPAEDATCEPFVVAVQAQLPCPAGLFLAGKATAGSTPGDIAIAYDQFPAPNDNSYGTNSVGWGDKGHTFGNLTGSDKAGFQVIRPNNTVALSFNIDYISAKTGTPSGYASLGPFGGDGDVVVAGTPALVFPGTGQIEWDTSLSRNLNGLQSPFGTYPLANQTYFTGGVQTIGKPATAGCTAAQVTAGTCADLLVNSPPVNCALATGNFCILTSTSQYPLKGSDGPPGTHPWNKSYTNPEYANVPVGSSQFEAALARNVSGWNFHDTFFVTLKSAYLTSLGFDFGNWEFAQFNAATNTATCTAGKWCVSPNPTVLHNSPPKPCPVVTPPGGGGDLTVTKRELKDNQAKITIKNNGTVDEFIDNVKLSWPVATNGALKQIKLGGDVMWTGTDNSGSIDFTKSAVTPGGTGITLAFDPNKRKIQDGQDEVLNFIFEKKPIAALTVANYPVSSAHFESGFTLSPLMSP